MKINNKLTLAVGLALSLSACSPKTTTEQYLAQAESFIEKHDNNSAIIALKNAVRLDAKSSAVRFALGAAYLSQGDYKNAEKELEKAEELGSNNESLLSNLVQAKVKLNKFDYAYQAVEKSQLQSSSEQVVILTYAGIAAIHQNKPAKAKEYIESAISISDDSVYGQVGKAYLSHSDNNFKVGINSVDELLTKNPNFAEALLLKGYLLQASELFNDAAETFEQYAKLRPKDVTARFFIAQNYVFAQNYTAAEPQVDLLLKFSKYHPLTNQLKAEIEYSKGNYKSAKEHAEISFQQDDSFNISKMIAGISAFKLGDFEQSYQYLISVKDKLPPQHLVRKLIINLQFKLGYNVEAVDELKSLVDINEADPATLTMASNQLLASGDVSSAEDLLQMSIDLKSDNPLEISKQGVTQLRLNHPDKGLETLENVLKLDPDLAFAEQSLAIGYLANGQYEQALVIAKKWQSSDDDQTKKIQGYLLEANVLEQQKKLSEAKAFFNKALALDNNNIAALYKLAVFAHEEGDINQAFSYYTQLLEQQPNHKRAIINFNRLIAFSIKENKSLADKAIDFFQNELKEHTNNNYLKMSLGYVYKLNGNHAAAIDLFKDIESSKNPLNGIEVALGDSYKALGEWQDAEKSYKKAVENAPKNLRAINKLLALFEQLKQFDKALDQIESTLRFNQDNIGFVLLKTYYQSLLRINPNASDLAKIKNNTKAANHWVFDKTQGNLAYNQQDFDASTQFYASAYKKQVNSINAINWSKSVALKGNKKEAIKILEAFITSLNEKQPAVVAKIMLAGAYLNVNELDKASAIYKEVVKVVPKNIIVLNNSSYIALQNKQIKESLEYAEQLIKLVD
ncbi:MAG: PEP-CTERM system TPR-repeat protein PrsT, partial [Colwellia sp.]|nr:PEP-CTERM system TPR-repeat protein PrsT [Colwellia sp.]